MASYISVPILALAAALQATILQLIGLQGGGPNLVLLIVLSWSINSSLRQGVIWAFVGGTMLDLLSALPLGTSSIPLLILVFAVGGLGQQVYNIGILWLGGLTAGGTLLQQLTQMVLMIMLGYHVLFVQNITYIVIPTMIYNLILILPVYWFMRRIQRRVSPVEQP
jgi:rod shape-determining protein MreD